MGIFDGIELTIETGISFGRKARVRRLPLGERAEFVIAYDSYLVSGGAEAEAELARRVTDGRRRFLTRSDRQKILRAALLLNSDVRTRGGGRPADPDRIAKLIAYFGREFGFSKDETLALFPEEIDAIIRENERLKANEWTLLAGLIHLPAETVGVIERVNPMNDDRPIDRDAVEGLKNAQRRKVCR
ncbi:MAG: hypothetical protein A2Y33_12295 [Spirochaetes bacterium GWF1_51_8]|nr:MAG: hypothetical protein A2Y33_12295 [Spirochaetes bacterium GWF1_51_8]